MITPEDLLLHAEALAQGTTEVEWRDAISRGYYAAFHAGRNLLVALGFQFPRQSAAHPYLWLRLTNAGEAEVQDAGGDLNDLVRERNRADYDIGLTITQPHAQTWVAKARHIVERIANAEVEPIRSQVLQAIRDYERNVLHQVTYQGP